jgi:hypothetical protein
MFKKFRTTRTDGSNFEKIIDKTSTIPYSSVIYVVALHHLVMCLGGAKLIPKLALLEGSIVLPFSDLQYDFIKLYSFAKQHGRMPIELAAVYGTREDVEILFPLTNPIPTVADWSVDGVITYANLERKKLEVCYYSSCPYLLASGCSL